MVLGRDGGTAMRWRCTWRSLGLRPRLQGKHLVLLAKLHRLASRNLDSLKYLGMSRRLTKGPIALLPEA